MSQEIISEIKNHTGIITLKTEDGLNSVNRILPMNGTI